MTPPNKKDDILLQVIKALESGNLRPTFHAQVRMKERNILFTDMEEAIYNASREDHKDEFDSKTEEWKYALRGLNNDGAKDIRVVVVFKDPATLVLTVIDLNKRG